MAVNYSLMGIHYLQVLIKYSFEIILQENDAIKSQVREIWNHKSSTFNCVNVQQRPFHQHFSLLSPFIFNYFRCSRILGDFLSFHSTFHVRNCLLTPLASKTYEQQMAFSTPLQVEQCDVKERLLKSIVGMSNTEKSQLIGCLIAKWVFSAWLQLKFLPTKMHLHISNALTKFHTTITLLTDLVSIIKLFFYTKQNSCSKQKQKQSQISWEREVNLCWLIVEEILEMLL